MSWRHPSIIGGISGILVAAGTDLDAFVKAREKSPTVRFDIWLMVARMLKGGIAGALAGGAFTI